MLSKFNLEYCKTLSEEKLRKVYSHESAETLDALVKAVKASKVAHKDIIEPISEIEKEISKEETTEQATEVKEEEEKPSTLGSFFGKKK